jgi:hypothetical protein
MHQRRFTTPASAVLRGREWPLRSLFRIITDRHTGDIVDNNFDDEHGPSLSLKGVRQRLTTFGIVPQVSLPDDLAVDHRAHTGHWRIVDDVSGDEIMVAMAPPQGLSDRERWCCLRGKAARRPVRLGKWSPGGGGASPAASINRAANGAPLAGGRFVRATACGGDTRPCLSRLDANIPK